MNTKKLWFGFVLWEALGLTIGLLIAGNFTRSGGGFNAGPFLGAIVGMALLWWAMVFGVSTAIDYAKRV